MNRDQAKREAKNALKQLNQSERGQKLLVVLLKLGDGPLTGADMKDQKAVLALLKITFYGFRSVILDALDAAKVPPCIRAVNEINKMMAKDQFAE